jgi:hypothetical protein
MSKLSYRFGRPYLVAPSIVRRFKEKGIYFKFVSKKGAIIFDNNGKTLTKIDILLENEELIVAVKVKMSPVENDVDLHIKRMEILRENMNRFYRDDRRIQGVIAGAIYKDSVKEAARNAGFYVIEQYGPLMKMFIPEGWQPKEW